MDDKTRTEHMESGKERYGNMTKIVPPTGTLTGWQPIETAPKDTLILLANGTLVYPGFIGKDTEPPENHWQPFPKPPKQ